MRSEPGIVARSLRNLAFVALSWTVVACTVLIPAARRPTPAPASARVGEEIPVLKVPPGQLPPPGMCRVWFPGRPPGRQPRAVACTVAMANAPAGTWVLYRSNAREVHARVIDAQRAGVVIVVRVYGADGGRYLRTERP